MSSSTDEFPAKANNKSSQPRLIARDDLEPLLFHKLGTLAASMVSKLLLLGQGNSNSMPLQDSI
jgi:hypothetical protein